MKLNYLLRHIAISVILLLVLGVNDLPVEAQLVYQWSLQKRIPDYGDESRPPCLVADQNRTVHVLNNQAIGETEDAVVYRQWTVAQGWSNPVDVLLSPVPEAPQVQSCFLDGNGTIHLVFYAGNERQGALYYSRAPAVNAHRASAWSTPEVVGEDAIPSAIMTGDDQGNLFVLFTGKREGTGLYEVHSTDSGDSWSSPGIVSLIPGDDLIPYGTRLALDQQGRLHAVWSKVDTPGIHQEIYYARLEADHSQWSTPMLIAKREEGDYEAAWPSIIEYENELMMIYQQGLPATRWMRRSRDGGQTWSQPVQPFSHVGEYEHAVLLIDSNKVLHMVLGNRSGACCHGMWHSIWLGDRWSELEAIVMSPKSPTFDPSAPRAVISQGNVMLVTWWTDTGGGPRNGAWYSYAVLDAPELPVVPLPVPTAVPTPGAIPTLAANSLTPTPLPKLASNTNNSLPATSSPGVPIALATVAVSVLIAAMVTLRVLRTHTRI